MVFNERVGDDLTAAFEHGYSQGQLDMLNTLALHYYGKQMYFLQDDGTIYSRVSCKYMNQIAAITELILEITSD